MLNPSIWAVECPGYFDFGVQENPDWKPYMAHMVHGSLSAVTHAPFMRQCRGLPQSGPVHESAGVGKLVNAALL